VTKKDAKRLLVIDDEENMRYMLREILEQEGYEVCLAADGSEGLALLDQQAFDTILCDLRMPGMDGLEFLRQAAQLNVTATIITMSAYGTIDLAIETMQRGAYDYISKPFKPAEILLALKKAEERERLKQENVMLRREVEERYGFASIIGKSPGMVALFDMIRKVAGFKTSVLITGESGTGKELVARAIHYNSNRKERIFLAINCGAIPETLLESELFGHKKGAFTGAIQDHKGFFEEADGGTLFLDEIGDIPTNLQVKLLRALQEGEIRKIGEERSVSVDVRVLAATSKDLLKEIEKGTFREDLYYRLNVLPLHIPPLRERCADIPLLIEHFIKKYNGIHGLAISGISPSARAALTEYAWPGNVRELENIIERSMVLNDKNVLDVVDIPQHVSAGNPPAGMQIPDDVYSIKKLGRLLEEQLIIRALKKTGGNKSQAARLLELSYPALLSKITEYGIE
jgi:two-component system response regulator AtoC